MHYTIKPTLLWFTILVLGIVFVNGFARAENIDPENNGSQYAWGENAGWINLEPMGDGGPGAEVEDSKLTGYIWAENIGWISLSCENTSSCATVDYGVANDGVGNLYGYAWNENVGWISFSCVNTDIDCASTYYGVAIDPATGQFSGKAWGENIGWITFDPLAGGVKTSWGANTAAGQDVTVYLGSGVTVTFDNVTAPGNTTMTASDTPPGDSFFINFISVYYNINTTATFDGDVRIEITYDDSGILPAIEPFLKIFKFDGSPPVARDITDYSSSPNPDTAANIIIGVTDGFSIFAMGVPVKQLPIVALSELLTTGDDETDKHIQKAIESIEKSLAPELWESDSTLTKKGKKVFDNEKKAVKNLQKLIKDKKVPDYVKDVCENVTDELLTADKLLAETALTEAKAYEGMDKKVDKEIEKSEKELEKATKELEKGKPEKAIDHYKKAWEHAQKAMKKVPEPDEDLE